MKSTQVRAIVDLCVSLGLFDKALFTTDGILTSRAIQSRYLDGIARRTGEIPIIVEYWLLEVTHRAGLVFVHKNGETAYKNPDNEQQKPSFCTEDFWCGQKEIKVLDPNITACAEKRDLMQQYIDTRAIIDFTQGLDIRLLNQYDIEDINKMRVGTLHFAWDNPKDDLESKFSDFAKGFRRKSNIGMVYCLTNYNSTMEENLYRIYTLRDMGYDPYVMVYDKPNAPKEVRRLQRWCNNKIIFKSCPKFEDYQT